MIWCHLTFLVYHLFDTILGHIWFRLRVIDLHRATWSPPLIGCALRRRHVRFLIMIPQWSLFGVIQPNPHFSAIGCRHASYSGRCFLNVWVWFGLWRSHVWWGMIWCHLTFLIYHIFDAILGHIFVSIKIYGSSWSHTIISTYEIRAKTITYSLFYHDPPVEPFLSHLVMPTLFSI